MKLFDHNSSTKHEIIKPIELASITLDFQMLEDVSMELKHVFVFVIKKWIENSLHISIETYAIEWNC